MSTDSYLTGGGIRVHRTVEPIPVGERHRARRRTRSTRAAACCSRRATSTPAATRAGTWASSTRRSCSWRAGAAFRVEALNARGRVLLAAIAARARGPRRGRAASTRDGRRGRRRRCARRRAGFAEEERSRQPSVFSRAARARSTSSGTPTSRTSGSTAPSATTSPSSSSRSALRLARPADQRDLVLYLPDELVVVDHRREVAQRRRYDFEVDGRSTAGLPRDGRARARTSAPPRVAARAATTSRASTRRSSRVAREAFKRGDLFEVVPGPDLLRALPVAAVRAVPPPARAQPRRPTAS